MKVFKLGGGCMQHPEAVKGLDQLLKLEPSRPLVIVVSAMGKTTSLLEKVFQQKLNKQPYDTTIQQLYRFHQEMIERLLGQLRQEAYQMLALWQEKLTATLAVAATNTSLLDKLYSTIVAEGELIASALIRYYLQERNVKCTWLDARRCIKTNKGFCNAHVDWVATQHWTEASIIPLLSSKQVIITQGFIGSNETGETTTLGKEGSDFTGAVLASVLNAHSLTIWKDVPGIMNADPRLFKKATKLDRISYKAVAEMAFYGAKVLHPKTVQPLAAKHIPLYVKPLYQPQEAGTAITNGQNGLVHPVYILRKDQGLVHLSREGLAFFDETCLKEVLCKLMQHNISINMVVKSAYKLSICLNTDSYRLNSLLTTLRQQFKVHYYAQVQLLTVIHQDIKPLQTLLNQRTILLAQAQEHVYQVVLPPNEGLTTSIERMLSAH
ncbi:MAG: aspartate kinase [Bacteroidota bacterium]